MLLDFLFQRFKRPADQPEPPYTPVVGADTARIHQALERHQRSQIRPWEPARDYTHRDSQS